MQKPFRLQDLAKRIEQVLSETRERHHVRKA
jgi:hypothetical protein